MLLSILKKLFGGHTALDGSSASSDSRFDLTDGESRPLQFGEQLLNRCKYGWMLHSGPHIGKCFELYGEYSESEVEIFKLFVQPGDIVLDIGANIGDLTLPLARLVGDQGRVYAYESNPSTFNTLCANLALNNIVNVKPINSLVGDSNSEIIVGDSMWGKSAYIGEIWPTTFTSIDQLDIDRLRFIKLDVEGNELSVLRSGLQHIERFHPILYFENDRKDKSEALLDFVLGLGYRIFFHEAPLFRANNFFNNSVNHWAPDNFVSMMMLALPPGIEPPPWHLPEVHSSDDWWSDKIN